MQLHHPLTRPYLLSPTKINPQRWPPCPGGAEEADPGPEPAEAGVKTIVPTGATEVAGEAKETTGEGPTEALDTPPIHQIVAVTDITPMETRLGTAWPH